MFSFLVKFPTMLRHKNVWRSVKFSSLTNIFLFQLISHHAKTQGGRVVGKILISDPVSLTTVSCFSLFPTMPRHKEVGRSGKYSSLTPGLRSPFLVSAYFPPCLDTTSTELLPLSDLCVRNTVSTTERRRYWLLSLI